MRTAGQRLLIRCDVSPAIGTGHLRRCLALARELKASGAFVVFAWRAVDFDVAAHLDNVADDSATIDWSLGPEADAHAVAEFAVRHAVDAVVIDHHRADAAYQQRLYGAGVPWLQFDWAGRQPLWADWVLNASPAADEDVYRRLAQRESARLLLGPAYALLRREFRDGRSDTAVREEVRTILLTFGGGDDRGATLFCLEATRSLQPSAERVVLLSRANPRATEILDWARRNGDVRVTVLVDELEIARHMARADLAIIAGGTTATEVAAMGVPSVIVQVSDDQAANAPAWEAKGAASSVGRLETLTPAQLQDRVAVLIADPRARRAMAAAGRSLVDGRGAERVCRTMLEDLATRCHVGRDA